MFLIRNMFGQKTLHVLQETCSVITLHVLIRKLYMLWSQNFTCFGQEIEIQTSS